MKHPTSGIANSAGCVFVVTGMHRSGTSLVASALRKAGVFLGSELLAPNEGNPRGYFEDVAFVDFHQTLLRKAGLRVLAGADARPKAPNAREAAVAKRLIRERRGHDRWGWKDPRTALFLDFWADLLPSARFLLVFRHPIEVSLSLLRRGSDFDLEALADPLVALSSWRLYNRLILDFHRRRGERTFLFDVRSLVGDFEGCFDTLARKLDVALPLDGVRDVVHPEELSSSAGPAVDELLKRVDLASFELHRKLESEADFKSPPKPPETFDPAAERRLELLSRWLDEDPVQLIHNQAAFPLFLTLIDPRTARIREQKLGDRLRRLLRESESLRDHAENLRGEVNAGHDRYQRLEEHVRNLEDLRRQDRRHLERLAEHVRGLEGAGEESQSLLRDLRVHAGNLEEALRRERETQGALSEHAANLESRHGRDQVRIQELESHVENLERLRQAAQDQLASLTVHVENLESRHLDAREQTRSLVVHVENLESRHRSDREELASLASHVENLEALRREDRELLGNLAVHAENLEQAWDRTGRALRECETYARKLEGEIASRDRHVADLEALIETFEVENLREVLEATQNSARGLGRRVEQLHNELRELRSHLGVRLLRRLHLLR